MTFSCLAGFSSRLHFCIFEVIFSLFETSAVIKGLAPRGRSLCGVALLVIFEEAETGHTKKIPRNTRLTQLKFSRTDANIERKKNYITSCGPDLIAISRKHFMSLNASEAELIVPYGCYSSSSFISLFQKSTTRSWPKKAY